MNEIQLDRLDLNLLVTFEVLMDEGSVAKAAEKLGKTPSAVSHALARLREQVGDPLLVKVGGKMMPSPFALILIDDIRPILRSIQRVVSPPRPFDPATSTRVFRIAVPAITGLISEVFAHLNSEAPGISLEWVGLGDRLDAVPPTMSGGQKQRVAVARAVISRPQVLLADGPTGSMDDEIGMRVIRLCQALHAEGTAVVIATHNSDLVRSLPYRTLHLANGQVQSIGETDIAGGEA